MCWRTLLTLIYFEWHLIPRWLLRSIFVRFPELLFKGFVSLILASIYWYTAHWEMLLVSCPAHFLLLFCSVYATNTNHKLLDHVVSGASFLTGGVLECNIVHRWSVAALCMMYKIRCNPKHPLYGELPVPYLTLQVKCCALVTHWFTYAATRSTAWLLFPSQYIFGMFLVTLYSMMWDWLLLRSDQWFFLLAWANWLPLWEGSFDYQSQFYWLPFWFLFSLSLLCFYGLVLCGWDYWLISYLALSRLCIADLFW